MKPEIKVSFNKAWVKTVKKAHFVKVHSKAYPHLNLEEEYDKIVGTKKEPKEAKENDKS